MKMKEAKQMPLHEKFHKFCVDVSTCVAVGGGGNLELSFLSSLCYFHDKKHHKKNSKGFTLAEILITLSVIAVVAAITLPSLITNYQKRVAAERLKKCILLCGLLLT